MFFKNYVISRLLSGITVLLKLLTFDEEQSQLRFMIAKINGDITEVNGTISMIIEEEKVKRASAKALSSVQKDIVYGSDYPS